MKNLFIFIIALFVLTANAQDSTTAKIILGHSQNLDLLNKANQQLLTENVQLKAFADSVRQGLIGVQSTANNSGVTKAWVDQRINDKAVLDTTYSGNAGIKRKDGKPLMHKQIVSAQRTNQKIAVQASSDIFTVQEYFNSDGDSTKEINLLKKMRKNAQKIKEKAEKNGYKSDDVMNGKVVIIR